MLGYASLGGFAGTIAAIIIGGSALGISVPDNAENLPFVMMVGACIGWVVGATLGLRAGTYARPAGSAGRTSLLLCAVIIALGEIATFLSPVPTRLSGGVTYLSWWHLAGGPAFEVVMIVATALVLATFLAVSRRRESTPSLPLEVFTGGIGRVGLVVGVTLFSLAMLAVKENWSIAAYDQRYQAVSATLSSLLTAAEKQQERSGSYPTTLEEVLAAGGRIRRGTQVEFAGVMNGAFCVRVGIDIGEDRAGDPHSSGKVHPRPQRSHSSTSEEDWRGNPCWPSGGADHSRSNPCPHYSRNPSAVDPRHLRAVRQRPWLGDSCFSSH